MNRLLKLQSDLIKNIKTSYSTWYYAKIDDSYYISDGHIVHIIPDADCFLDFSKLFTSSSNRFYDQINSILKDIPKTFDLKNLKMTVEHDYMKSVAKVFYNEHDNKYITIAVDRLKGLSDKKFKGTDEKSPVFIYDNDTLICIVMPIQMNCKILSKLRGA